MPVPAPVTVWRVELRRGGLTETKGTLSLESDAVVFTPAAGGDEDRIRLAGIRKVGRTLGSPVLTVVHLEGQGPARTAFYFAQPPPMRPAGGDSRRKVRRQSATYLGTTNKALKGRIKEWEHAIREAKASAG